MAPVGKVPEPMNAADKLSESIWDEPDTSVEILTPDEAEQDILAQGQIKINIKYILRHWFFPQGF